MEPIHCTPFRELPYARPDFDALQKALDELAARAASAASGEELIALVREKDALMEKANLNAQLAFIRCYLDSSDSFYAAEMQACSTGFNLLDDSAYLSALLNSPHAGALDAAFGPLYLLRQQDSLRLTGKGRELIAREEELANRYQQLKATLRISLDGRELSEGQLMEFLTSPDRALRRRAWEARQQAYLNHKPELDRLLDELVGLRLDIAGANGFASYADYINLRRGRHGYGQAELREFCAQVKREIVPLCGRFARLQARRLGLDVLCPWDANLYFPEGNPKPVGDGPALLEAGRTMYDRLSPDIAALFRAMAGGGYIDVSASPNKISGMGFCESLHALKMPYIFGNCDGSVDDVTVVTHEMGHAYQMWLCMKNQPVPEYTDMPNDVVEIPSKAMEQFTVPFAELFFGSGADRFRSQFLQGVAQEICAFCAVQEFEDWLYTHSGAGAGERIARFNAIRAEYTPGVDRSAAAESDTAGAELYRNIGIYMFPGYLVSYALSDMGALELKARYDESPQTAWADFRTLCSLGGSLDYDGLMAAAHLSTAYAPGSAAAAAAVLERELEKEESAHV